MNDTESAALIEDAAEREPAAITVKSGNFDISGDPSDSATTPATRPIAPPDADPDAESHVLIIGGRRSGKTRDMIDATARALAQGKKVLIVSPTIPMAAEVIRAMVDIHPELVADNLSSEIRSRSGGAARVVASQSIESPLGEFDFDLIAFDEGQLIPGLKRHVEAARRSLNDGGRIRVYGTAFDLDRPITDDDLYQMVRSASGDPAWRVEHWPTERNPHVAPEEIGRIKADVPEDVFASDFGAQFVRRSHPTNIVIKSMDEDRVVVGGWGVVFGGADLYKTYFTKNTDFWLDKVPGPRPALYDHTFNLRIANEIVGVGYGEKRDYGVWVEAELDRHKDYMEEVLKLIQLGVLGWSSGSAPHLVRYGVPDESSNTEILCWPVVEWSLTPTPAEPRTLGVQKLRSITQVDPALRAFLPPEDTDHVSADEGDAATNVAVKTNFDAIADEVTARIERSVAERIEAAFERRNRSAREAIERAIDELAGVEGVVAAENDAATTRHSSADMNGAISDAPDHPQASQKESSRMDNELEITDEAVAEQEEEVAVRTAQAASAASGVDIEALVARAVEMAAEKMASALDLSAVVTRAADAAVERLNAEPAVRAASFAVPAATRTAPGQLTSASKITVEGAFKAYLRAGVRAFQGRDGASIRAALNEGTAGQGGYLVPEEFANELIKGLRELSIMRGVGAREFTMGAYDTLHLPQMTFGAAAALTSEAAAFDQVEPTFAEIVFTPYKFTRLSKASEEVMADSRFDIWGQVLQPDYTQAFAYAENSYFTTGTGTSQPQGIVTGAGVGKTAASATAITADEIIDLYHSLNHLYRRNAVFMMHDSTLKVIRKLKDGEARYLWEPNVQMGQPSMLLGRPVITNNWMPEIATTTKPIWFGDPSYFWIADRQGLEIRRLDELYSANGQVGFRAFKRFDSRVVLAEAMKVLQMA